MPRTRPFMYPDWLSGYSLSKRAPSHARALSTRPSMAAAVALGPGAASADCEALDLKQPVDSLAAKIAAVVEAAAVGCASRQRQLAGEPHLVAALPSGGDRLIRLLCKPDVNDQPLA